MKTLESKEFGTAEAAKIFVNEARKKGADIRVISLAPIGSHGMWLLVYEIEDLLLEEEK